ncbi:hypothetical protein ACJ2A9_07600 [Anaerobacillus sp. MEB173]|uniref:hypothetical protein n=1 Tax=Anaerobacillus sp. MEB173 TaxID=3383345 RepID=UPI003F9245E1
MKDIVRGVSIHSTSTGLLYYVHYDLAGTKEVTYSEYEDAVATLNEWKSKMEEAQQKTKEFALNFN